MANRTPTPSRVAEQVLELATVVAEPEPVPGHGRQVRPKSRPGCRSRTPTRTYTPADEEEGGFSEGGALVSCTGVYSE